jgi:two-component system, NtrC family, sensor histidine kinase HydH
MPEPSPAATAAADLLARAVHDMRGPLQVIRGECFSLRRAGASGRQRAGLGVIDAEATRVSAALEGLLRLARAGGVAGEATSLVPIGALAERAARAGAAAGRPRRVAVMARISRRGALWVLGEADGLGRALENLVLNAVRHSPRGSRVTLRARRAGDEVHVTVRDQGPGVPPAERERIFLPGVRGSGAGGPGAGLGLAIARDAARATGGRLELVDADGGACFRLALPAAEGPA